MAVARSEADASRRIGDYELLTMLGRGGMAEVWLARRRGPGSFERKVVVKRIRSEFANDEAFVKMFVAEARLSARLSHPNIVAVHELGEHDGLYYIVMEFVRGPDLRAVMHELQSRGTIEPGVGVFVVLELARALAYAHEITDDDGRRLRIVHRDVSPSNVVISFDGNVKLVDFGIAKALDEVHDEHTRTGSIKGKIGYMAPEQLDAAGASSDHRADLWAAGVVLWETLTARRLFRGANEVHTLDLVRTGPIEKPSQHNPKVTPELDRIVLKALSRDVAARYQTGDELAQDLDRVAAELGFGPAQMARVVRDDFEDEAFSGRVPRVEPDESEVAALPDDGEGQTPAIPITPSGAVVRGIDTGALTKHERPAKPARTSRKLVLASTGGVLLLGATAFAVFLHRPATNAAAPAAPPVVVKPTIRSVKLHVDSTPRGSLVFVGDESAPRGETPIDLIMPYGGARSSLHVELSGYLSARQEFVPDHEDWIYFSLAQDARKGSEGEK